jgi:c-di-GMP-binding flagellar brake protein YcgR
MRDKRKFPRVDEKWKISYQVLDKERYLDTLIRQYAVNISGGGICFISAAELEPNAMVAINLESPQFPSAILALAKVVRCKQTREGYEIGAEFAWVGWQNNHAQQAIADYIASAARTKSK